MATIDLHEKPFDDKTIAKLEMFEAYAAAWIPTFVMRGDPEICIFDFFAGTGYDKDKVPGSPIRILERLKEQIGNLFQKGVKVKVFLNEYQPGKTQQDKFNQLKSACENFLKENSRLARRIEISYYNEDFEHLFPKLYPLIEKYPSLVYLDQNGIKFLSERYFNALEKTRQTDFLYFLSSSYIWRFGKEKEFKMHLDIDMEKVKQKKYSSIHRSITEQIRSRLPADSELMLYPFSIKKGANIHGIIFGASHPRAVDKFLNIAWQRNSINGEADFDLDDDMTKGQYHLFEAKKPTKLEAFQEKLRAHILEGVISNNFEAYDFTIKEGHIAKHAADEIKRMKKANLIEYDRSSPLITYENVYRNKNFLIFRIVEKKK
ncbi:three-Cys-motif partner protein TcmP [Echinicola marina]|uniref:three-Cys-motif partner protein TcmP n=1 Tax=Echinicola marina TaxID=2859768 RepID=UPI001CF65682|nr:three-Cys-motif partner protein TcmP [Echinicola marina]UCS91953.1 three-Cys-motif partner protein TcmP [Echinicola marina]